MLGDDVMALYGFAQGLIQEAGIRIKQLMEQNLQLKQSQIRMTLLQM